MKEIIISSLYLLENVTSLSLVVYWGSDKFKLQPL